MAKKPAKDTKTAKAVRTGALVEDLSHLSPEMAACRPGERAFIMALFQGKNQTKSAIVAGYSPNSAATWASNAIRLPRVVAAIEAESKRFVRALAPNATKALAEIITDGSHKDRLRAANMVIERIDPTVTRVEGKIEHRHTVSHEDEALSQLRTLKALSVAHDKLVEIFGQFGLERLERQLVIADQSKANVIEAEFVEVTDAVPDDDPLLAELKGFPIDPAAPMFPMSPRDPEFAKLYPELDKVPHTKDHK